MKTILLIEDDYVDVESVKRLFKKESLPVKLYIAHNGVDALAMLTGNSQGDGKITPDIILLDINMPKMNGIEFLRIIKNYYSLKNIKTFILSTSAEEYDKIAAGSLGIDGYLLKPLDFKRNEKGITALLKELASAC
jgi:CheY-like chemotaxis protein